MPNYGLSKPWTVVVILIIIPIWTVIIIPLYIISKSYEVWKYISRMEFYMKSLLAMVVGIIFVSVITVMFFEWKEEKLIDPDRLRHDIPKIQRITLTPKFEMSEPRNLTKEQMQDFLNSLPENKYIKVTAAYCEGENC